jgi:hypothetical protein
MTATDSMHSRLKALGLVKNKHVPAIYLRASINQRRDLLAGLMDTDGSCSPGGHVEFCSTSKRLAMACVELARSLSYKPILLEDRAKLNGKDCGPRYRVSWTPHTPVFKLRRKLARQHSGKKQAMRNHRRYIVSVEPVESPWSFWSP